MASDENAAAARSLTHPVERLRLKSTWKPPQDGFSPVVTDEGKEFVEARLMAHKACHAQLEEHNLSVFKGLNERVLGDIAHFLREETRRVQRSFAHDATPPYVELPAALVHTGCHSADLPLVLQQIREHMLRDCSPHVAVLQAKECSSLLMATRSLVAQLVTARTAPSCTFDLDVLSGWHSDLCSGRVAARARQASVHLQATSAAWTPLVVLVDDAEHFPAEILNDLIYSCASLRSHSGAPLPLTFVFSLPAGVDALHRLLHRSTLILLNGRIFTLASTERSIDEIVSRLLRSPALPQLNAAAYAALLDGLSEQHGSTTAFCRQVQWLMLKHFRTSLLSFLIPIEPFADPKAGNVAARTVREDLEGLCDSLRSAQLCAIQELPSVAPLVPPLSSQKARESWLKQQLPDWLTSVVRARRCRAAALGCVEALLAVTFPGANRTVTATRHLYLDLLTGPALQSRAIQLGLDKCRERGALPYKVLRALLNRCAEQLTHSASLLPAMSQALHSDESQPEASAATPSLSLEAQIRELNSLIADSASAPLALMPPSDAAASAATSASSSKAAASAACAPAASASAAAPRPAPAAGNRSHDAPAKRRRTALQSFVASSAMAHDAGGGSSTAGVPDGITPLSSRVAMWFERLVREHADAPSLLPLHEVWESSSRDDQGLRQAFAPCVQRTLDMQLQAILAEARKAKSGTRPPSQTAASAAAIPSDSSRRSPRENAATLSRLASERQDAERKAAEAKAQAKAAAATARASAKATGAPVLKVELPESWATAVAAETLREFTGRRICTVDWFNAFSAHGVAKKSGLPPEALLARFVVAINDLQMIGFAKVSNRPRGTIEKYVFG